MSILVLSTHPDLSTSTANRKWFEALSNTEGIIVRDLMAAGGSDMLFDPSVELARVNSSSSIL